MSFTPAGVIGVDLSEYQQPSPSLAGVAYVLIKVSEGLRDDPMFLAHLANANEHAIPALGYHFSRSSVDVAAALAHFLSRVQGRGLVGLALDVEGNDAFTKPECAQWHAGIRAAGSPSGQYQPAGQRFDAGQDWNWIADYRTSSRPGGPPKPWDVWQYGPRGGIDGDVLAGSLASFLAKTGGTVAQAPITDENQHTVTHAAGQPWFDLDGKTKVGATGAQGLGARTSPYGAAGMRAIYASVPDSAHRRVVLIHPTTDIVTPPVDCSAQVQSAVNAALDHIQPAVDAVDTAIQEARPR